MTILILKKLRSDRMDVTDDPFMGFSNLRPPVPYPTSSTRMIITLMCPNINMSSN